MAQTHDDTRPDQPQVQQPSGTGGTRPQPIPAGSGGAHGIATAHQPGGTAPGGGPGAGLGSLGTGGGSSGGGSGAVKRGGR